MMRDRPVRYVGIEAALTLTVRSRATALEDDYGHQFHAQATELRRRYSRHDRKPPAQNTRLPVVMTRGVLYHTGLPTISFAPPRALVGGMRSAQVALLLEQHAKVESTGSITALIGATERLLRSR
jgi:hypothetical protein